MKPTKAQSLTMDRSSLRKVIGVMPDGSDFIRYEQGEMDEQEMVEFFQGLVDSGLAWQLQGSYGRQAMRLIEAGLVNG